MLNCYQITCHEIDHCFTDFMVHLVKHVYLLKHQKIEYGYAYVSLYL